MVRYREIPIKLSSDKIDLSNSMYYSFGDIIIPDYLLNMYQTINLHLLTTVFTDYTYITYKNQATEYRGEKS